MSELDARLAKIRRQKAEARTTAASDFAQLNEGLAEAQSKLAELDAARQTLSEAVAADSRRIAVLRRRVTVGVVLVALVAALALALIEEVASRMVDEARTEAARIRTENAQEIAQARAEGEAALQALSQRLASREAALTAEIEAMGADLAQLGADRDAARADLEHFAELRQKIGFDLIPYRNRVVIVDPKVKPSRAGAPLVCVGYRPLQRANVSGGACRLSVQLSVRGCPDRGHGSLILHGFFHVISAMSGFVDIRSIP